MRDSEETAPCKGKQEKVLSHFLEHLPDSATRDEDIYQPSGRRFYESKYSVNGMVFFDPLDVVSGLLM